MNNVTLPYVRHGVAIALLLVIGSILPGQQLTEPATSPESQAQVIVYRMKNSGANAVKPSVYCDGVDLARLDNGYYFTIRVPPGKHTFRSNHKETGMIIEAQSGETYYITMEMGMNGFWSLKASGALVLGRV